MKTLLLIALFVFLVGPLRRPILRHGRFTIPALIGGIAGVAVGSYLVAKVQLTSPASLLLPIAMAVSFAAGIGQTCKEWLDGMFGGPRDGDRR